MVMKPEPIYRCFESICDIRGKCPLVVYMTPKGEVFNQEKVKEFSAVENIAILCGHYEGVDQRVIDEIVDRQISIGDYVLTGGEIPAVAFTDAVCRMVPGVLSDAVCFEEESHFNGLLEHPQYTKPYIWKDKEVPEVLISGHHANIEKWKKEKSISETQKYRPDLFKSYLESKNSN